MVPDAAVPSGLLAQDRQPHKSEAAQFGPDQLSPRASRALRHLPALEEPKSPAKAWRRAPSTTAGAARPSTGLLAARTWRCGQTDKQPAADSQTD